MSIKNTFIEVTEFDEAAGAAVGEGLRRVSSCPSLRTQSGTLDEAACSQDAKARSQPTSPTNEADLCNNLQVQDPISGFVQHPRGLPGDASAAPESAGKTPPVAEPAEQWPLVAEPWWKTPDTTRAPLDVQAAVFVPWSLRAEIACRQSSDPTEQFSGVGIPRVSEEHVECTTAMMRNVPCSLSRKGLIQLLDNNGFRGKYNFVYMPMDFKRGLCIGYAFVNLLIPEYFVHFREVFDGFNFRATQLKSSKICAVSLSKTQGLTANIERYQNSPIMSDEVPDSYKPVLFAAKRRIPFPKPTKTVPQILHRS